MGMNITLGCPRGYEPDSKVVSQAKEEAKRTGCEVKVVQDPKEAVKGADVIYTDVWASMGKEKERGGAGEDPETLPGQSRTRQRGEGGLHLHALPACASGRRSNQ